MSIFAVTQVDQAIGQGNLRFGQPRTFRVIVCLAKLDRPFDVDAGHFRVTRTLLRLPEAQRGVGFEDLVIVAHRRAPDVVERFASKGECIGSAVQMQICLGT